MDKKYWNTVAKNYDEEIFDVLDNDKERLIVKTISREASNKKIVNDFGCGIGKFLTLLSKKFKDVNAIDISEECLRTASGKYNALGNVRFLREDLTKAGVRLPKADFGICVNAIMMTGFPERANFFNNISKSINKNGKLLIVVPSMESFNYVNMRFHEWNLKDGIVAKESVDGLIDTLSGNVNAVLKGMISIDGVLTKHYLKEELEVLLRKIGFKIEYLRKIEYAWETEFVDPPEWLKDPFPWDWFVLAKKE